MIQTLRRAWRVTIGYWRWKPQAGVIAAPRSMGDDGQPLIDYTARAFFGSVQAPNSDQVGRNFTGASFALSGGVASKWIPNPAAFGPPTTGAHLVGDWVISNATGKVFVNTVAGTPGTWISADGTYNIKDYGAPGDNVGDDSPGTVAALAAMPSNGAGVLVFPGPAHKFLSMIDLTGKIGGLTLRGGSGLGLNAPTVTLNGGTLLPLFNWDTPTGGQNANLTFENLSLNANCPIFARRLDAIRFVNCSLQVNVSTADLNNAALVLEGVFWAYLDGCAFRHVANKPTVILRGSAAVGGSVTMTYLVRFRNCTYWGGAVQYQQNAPNLSETINISFQGCDTENLVSQPFLDLVVNTPSGTVVSPQAVKQITFIDCAHADHTGNCPIVKVGTNINLAGLLLLGVYGAGADDAIQVNGGQVKGALIVNPRGPVNINIISGNVYGAHVLLDDTWNHYGQIGAGAGAAWSNNTAFAGAAGPIERYGLSADLNAMHLVELDGHHYWGPGGAGGGVDVELQRSAAGVLSFVGTVATAASLAARAGLRAPHGAAPTAPVDGDVWTTTAGMFVRVNGVTKTVTLT